MPVLPSPEQITESQIHEANRLRKKYEDEAAEFEKNGIPFKDLDVDDVVTVVNRNRPDEWYRFRIVSISHGRDTSKPGDPEAWAISGTTSSHYGQMYTDDMFKVVDKRGQ